MPQKKAARTNAQGVSVRTNGLRLLIKVRFA